MSNNSRKLFLPKKFLKYWGLLIGVFVVVISLIVFFYLSDIYKALSLMNEFLKYWSGLLIGIIGTVISLIVFFYNRRKDRFNSLFEVFRYLNEDKHREARRVLYTKDDKPEKHDDKILSSYIILGFDAVSKNYPLERVCKDIVRDDLNHMGLLLKNNLMPENQFLDRYCTTVLRCEEKLRLNIKRRRKVRKYKAYLKSIDYLVNRAQEYYDKHEETSEDVQPNSL